MGRSVTQFLRATGTMATGFPRRSSLVRRQITNRVCPMYVSVTEQRTTWPWRHPGITATWPREDHVITHARSWSIKVIEIGSVIVCLSSRAPDEEWWWGVCEVGFIWWWGRWRGALWWGESDGLQHLHPLSWDLTWNDVAGDDDDEDYDDVFAVDLSNCLVMTMKLAPKLLRNFKLVLYFVLKFQIIYVNWPNF